MIKLGIEEEQNLRYCISLVLHTLPKNLYIESMVTDGFDKRIALVRYKNYKTYKVTLDGNRVEEIAVVV